MIVRADRRGLAYQTQSVHQALQPDVTVAIDITPLDPQGRWQQDFTPYPDAIITPWRGYTAPISDEALQALLSCAERGEIKTVRHVNPELFGGEYATAYWYPTSWQPVDLPPGPVMPLGIPDEWITGRPAGPGLALHVGGHRAAADRNGTKLAIDIAQRTREWRWRFTSQDGVGAVPRALIARSEFVKDTHDRWELYDGAAVLLLPRRYGGQSLPVIEAATRGLAVVLPDVSPNHEYPAELVHAKPGPWLKHKWIRTAVMDSTPGKRTMDRLHDPDELAAAQSRSVEWAQAHAWSNLATVWRDALAEVR